MKVRADINKKTAFINKSFMLKGKRYDDEIYGAYVYAKPFCADIIELDYKCSFEISLKPIVEFKKFKTEGVR
jgi:hypothetical protein